MPHIDRSDIPSVTQTLREFALGWIKFFYKKYGTVEAAEAFAKRRAEDGSRMHEGLETLIKTKSIDEAIKKVLPEEQPALRALDRELKKLEFEPLACEREMESKEFKYHGSLDLYGRIWNPSMLPNEDFLGTPVTAEPGVYVIPDLKTKEDGRPLSVSQLRKHALQLAAYGQAIKEEDGLQPELGLIIQLDVPTATVRLHAIYPLPRYFKPFHLQRQLFDYIEGNGEWQGKRKRRG